MRRIIGLAVVMTLLVVAALLFLRAFRAKAGSPFDQWTPEKIARETTEYLYFCESQYRKAEANIAAADSRIERLQQETQTILKAEKDKVGVGKKSLTEIKNAYQQAEKDKSWPAQWRGLYRTQEWMKIYILALQGQVDLHNAIVAECDLTLKELTDRTARVQDIRAKLEQQKKNLKAEQITQDLKDRLVQIKQKLAEAVAASQNPSGVLFWEDFQKLRQAIESECDQGISKVADNKPKPGDQWQSVQDLKDHLVKIKELLGKAADTNSPLPETLSLDFFTKKAQARLADRRFNAIMNEK